MGGDILFLNRLHFVYLDVFLDVFLKSLDRFFDGVSGSNTAPSLDNI